jgi:prepilin-type N-terminal cleavage/methylation domain-containing protein
MRISTLPRSHRGFSMVELLTTVAIIGIIAYMALPRVSTMQQNAERNLAISRAESLNMAVATMMQVKGRTQANLDWTTAANDSGRYAILRSYIGYAETSLALYMPAGYDVDFANSLDPLTKAVLKDSAGTTIPY